MESIILNAPGKQIQFKSPLVVKPTQSLLNNLSYQLEIMMENAIGHFHRWLVMVKDQPGFWEIHLFAAIVMYLILAKKESDLQKPNKLIK